MLGARCRHAPTCSEYAADAVTRHGLWRGFWLTAARLARCHPFGSSGWDPAPERLAPSPLAPWRYGDWSWQTRPAAPDADGAVDRRGG